MFRVRRDVSMTGGAARRRARWACAAVVGGAPMSLFPRSMRWQRLMALVGRVGCRVFAVVIQQFRALPTWTCPQMSQRGGWVRGGSVLLRC